MRRDASGPQSPGKTVMTSPSPSESFRTFLARLHARDSAADRMIFERFAGQLVVLARRRIDEVLRHKVDPEDVVQSTYKSFFHRYGDGELAVVNWNSLWGLLTRITLRKCAERVAYHRAECRDAAREASARRGTEDAATWPEALARDPTPLEAAELSETLQRLLSGLDEDERPIVELSLQGFSTREISEQLDRSERTVRRLRERIRALLERMQVEDP
jgi:RNA polymerase sigma-70 factor (ECF subfamily)